jgi:hypothetical protein
MRQHHTVDAPLVEPHQLIEGGLVATTQALDELFFVSIGHEYVKLGGRRGTFELRQRVHGVWTPTQRGSSRDSTRSLLSGFG